MSVIVWTMSQSTTKDIFILVPAVLWLVMLRFQPRFKLPLYFSLVGKYVCKFSVRLNWFVNNYFNLVDSSQSLSTKMFAYFSCFLYDWRLNFNGIVVITVWCCRLEIESYLLTISLLRYVMAAQALVGDARGTLSEKGWRRANGELASYDDISAFVIPICECSREMAKYTVKYDTLPSNKSTHPSGN